MRDLVCDADDAVGDATQTDGSAIVGIISHARSLPCVHQLADGFSMV